MKTDKLAEEILKKHDIPTCDWNYDIYITAMQEYHQAKLAEISDEDIEKWADKKILGLKGDSYIRKRYEGLIEGAKAFKNGEIKPSIK